MIFSQPGMYLVQSDILYWWHQLIIPHKGTDFYSECVPPCLLMKASTVEFPTDTNSLLTLTFELY